MIEHLRTCMRLYYGPRTLKTAVISALTSSNTNETITVLSKEILLKLPFLASRTDCALGREERRPPVEAGGPRPAQGLRFHPPSFTLNVMKEVAGDIMQKKGITQTDFAGMTVFSQAFFRKMNVQSGQATKNFQKIADALEVTGNQRDRDSASR